MRVVLIDNYDSFTYNVAQYLSMLGASVQVFRNDAIDVAGIRKRRPSHLVISPGPGYPDQAGVTVPAIKELSGECPILGICLGHQAIGEVFGGTVRRAPKPQHGKVSPITHHGKGLFRGLPSPLEVVRYHSLVVAAETMPKALRVTATTEDGLVMALAHRRHPTFGVQFHPESYRTAHGLALLEHFLKT